MDAIEALLIDGYCVVSDIVDQRMLVRLNQRFTAGTLSGIPQNNFSDSGAFVIADYADSLIADLITWPKTLALLANMGWPSPTLHSFYISTKPPRSAPLVWHSDLFYEWQHNLPAELMLLYYLQDTTKHNGCLRVIPGTHRLPYSLRHEENKSSNYRPGEVDVEVAAGDLFVGDRRILHATHGNASTLWRTCITISMAPSFDDLPQGAQELIRQNQCLPKGDPRSIDKRLWPLLHGLNS